MSFQKQTVWYDAVISDPDGCPPLTFDPANHWYVLMDETLRRLATLADGNYMVGLPGISPNLDVLAELRGTSEIMMDFFDRPDWIKQKLEEIDAVYFEVYDRMYDIVKQPDGSSAFYPFMLWGPGKVTQLQGDASAMISEDMFREFMMPGLQRVAEWTDYSLFHVDGPGMIKHVDALLEIETLDAIQFTPGPGVPRGGDPHWFAAPVDHHSVLRRERRPFSALNCILQSLQAGSWCCGLRQDSGSVSAGPTVHGYRAARCRSMPFGFGMFHKVWCAPGW